MMLENPAHKPPEGKGRKQGEFVFQPLFFRGKLAVKLRGCRPQILSSNSQLRDFHGVHIPLKHPFCRLQVLVFVAELSSLDETSAQFPFSAVETLKRFFCLWEKIPQSGWLFF